MRITVYAEFYDIVQAVPDTAAGVGRYIKCMESYSRLYELLKTKLTKQFPQADIRVAMPHEDPNPKAAAPNFAVEWDDLDLGKPFVAPTMRPSDVLRAAKALYFETLAAQGEWLVTEALSDGEQDDDREKDWDEDTCELLEQVVAWFEAHGFAVNKEVADMIERLNNAIDGLS